MELSKFIQHFRSQFEETDTIEFNSTTKFREIEEWDSLMALSIIAMVDEEYGIKLKGDDIRNSITIEDVYNTVASRK
jgi:acyl carrier protein